MSTPISACQVIKATNGDQKMFDHLVTAMDYNLATGHFTVFPCECKPPCERPSEEKIAEFNDRLMAAIKARREEARKKAPKRPTGSFDKVIFPVIKNMAAPLRAKDFLDATRKDDNAGA